MGNDSVTGSSGDDVVATGARTDTVNGEAGNDRFDLGAADGAANCFAATTEILALAPELELGETYPSARRLLKPFEAKVLLDH